ncbi:unnamed protein product [Adineta ricciae]|uniref:Uncharacterized protein n=1 Tax=Adineta ricciae TaxID=249248 RepID=A0A813VVX1_ADIRI|nr:unnamed protein product [Adineta ricciae]
MILFVIITIKSDNSFLFNTNNPYSQRIFDCFYFHSINEYAPDNNLLINTNDLTPYCRRISIDEKWNDTQGFIENNHTFQSLRLKGIQSKDLLQWSLTIDIIEQYEIYLNENNSQFDDYIFNNCSLHWFGSHCQYTFALNVSITSFSTFVQASLTNRIQYERELVINTCYPYLSECLRGPKPMCLDWREICDGKIDCINESFGIDEKYCEQLELKECEEDEYRCHNGAQCIPLNFFHDSWSSHDCLDGSDEDEIYQSKLETNLRAYLNCTDSMKFACEETMCRYPGYFSCGDGQCLESRRVFNIMNREIAGCKGTSRDLHYKRAIYLSAKEYSIDCYELLFCKLKFYYLLQNDLHTEEECLAGDWLLTNNCSLEYLSFPLQPLYYSYFQIIYSTKVLYLNISGIVPPQYICHDPRTCHYLSKSTNQIFIDLNCRQSSFYEPVHHVLDRYLASDANKCQLMGNINNYSSNSSLFYCERSDKYISKYRLIDGYNDCFYNEDENYFDSCLLNQSQRFNCTSENKCLSPIGIGLDFPRCQNGEDEERINDIQSIFSKLCSTFVPLLEEDNESTITNCEWWPCLTPYTRCDGHYHCTNGIDELNCPNMNCQINEYKCSTDRPNEYHCIAQEFIYEIPINCYENKSEYIYRQIFYSNNSLINNNHDYISWKEKENCLTKNDICKDESNNIQQNHFCPIYFFSTIPIYHKFYSNLYSNETLCYIFNFNSLMFEKNFVSTWNLGYLPKQINSTLLSIEQINDTKLNESKLIINDKKDLIEYCNRGIIIYEGKSYEKICLCPPNYFGKQCQWQSQRISLTIQIKTLGFYEEKIPIYEFFIYLIDNENEIIHYYEKINYIPSIDCDTKYNRYLLYPTQPKDLNSIYSIHIALYEKLTMNYYGSWFFSNPFPFLPVHRLAKQIQIPLEKSKELINCPIQCGNHGECFSFINNSTKFFCYCHEGYSGRFCNITYERTCSLDSFHLNASICLCPLNKFGSKCYLKHLTCQSTNNLCQNNGVCIPGNDRITKEKFLCLCTEDYTGSYCQYRSNRIDIHFKTDEIPLIIFGHFLTALEDREHQRTTTFKKIPFDQNSISLYFNKPFHVLIIEYFNHYYLGVLRETFYDGEYISTNIGKDHLCVNINELMNSTLLNYKDLRRMKYYPLQCLKNVQLKCFYDEKQICICDKNRFSNCWSFNHSMSYNCQGHNFCENKGKCFQDNLKCPIRSICKCEDCYYGSQCQFTTEGFSISLDVIFGYQIKPSISFLKQSLAVKITASLTICMFLLGLINGTLLILTFRNKTILSTGCGLYLLTNSIVSLLTVSFFTIKYSQLVIFQMNTITNHSFILINCILIDVLLKILLSYGEWLNGCVAVERVMAAVQGVRFNKRKSKSTSKYIILILLLIIIISYIHDPISRQLFNDKDEKRLWCIVKYSTNLKIYDKFINSFHFFMPFMINVSSAIIIIIQLFRIRSKAKKTSPSQTIFLEHIQQHKHLLISPCVLIILAIPRLIILFISRCMKSFRDPWLFLCGYYISFIPPLLLFIIFILPSENYKEEFLNVIKKIHLIKYQ